MMNLQFIIQKVTTFNMAVMTTSHRGVQAGGFGVPAGGFSSSESTAAADIKPTERKSERSNDPSVTQFEDITVKTKIQSNAVTFVT